MDKANSMILKVISSSQNNLRQFRQNGASSQAGLNAWEELDFVPPEYIESIIGKGGRDIKHFQQTYKVSIRVLKDAGKLEMKGSQRNKDQAIQSIKEFFDARQKQQSQTNDQTSLLHNDRKRQTSTSQTTHDRKDTKQRSQARPGKDGVWEPIKWFPSELFGIIIGKEGVQIRRLQEQYDLKICVDNDEKLLKVAGKNKNKEQFKEHLCDILLLPKNKQARKSNNNKNNRYNEDDNDSKNYDGAMDAFL